MTQEDYRLLEVLESVWKNGVAPDYKNGFIWNNEMAVHSSLVYHLRRKLVDGNPDLRIWHDAYYKNIYSGGGAGYIDLVLTEVDNAHFTRKIHDSYAQIKKEEDVIHLAAFEIKYARTKGLEGDLEKLIGMKERFELLPVLAFVDSSGSPTRPSSTYESTLPRFLQSGVTVLYGYPYHPEAWELI